MPVQTGERLAALRALLDQRQLNAYIVPSEDAHQSEYVADCDKRRQYISGFSGSYGFAVITQTAAALWTDGRYFLQANDELDENWTLMKIGLSTTKTREEWLLSQLPANGRVGLDSRLLSVSSARTLEEALKNRDHMLVPDLENLVDLVWTDRPKQPSNPVRVLSETFTGVSVTAKVRAIQQDLAGRSAKGLLITALDDVAWLFNLRGADVEFNPIFFAYAYVGLDCVRLYLDEHKYESSVNEHLGSQVELRSYNSVFEDMKQLANHFQTEASNDSANKTKAKIVVSRSCNLALCQALKGVTLDEVISPVTITKALKNSVELEGMRQAHRRDAAALCHYFAWLENLIENGGTTSELEAAKRSLEFRSKQEHYVGLSFETISASGPNAAIVHYRPSDKTCRAITSDEIYLCDSGAQYLDGTTDVTRTMHFGQPSSFQREAFTYVLKAHISLATATFPNGTSGFQLDILARRPLWSKGLDYRHGTGHGVGAFLNVHEGPHGIGTRVVLNEVPMQASMTVTNEPGYYQDGQFGIRIENVMIVQNVSLSHNFGQIGFLGFETITLVPIQSKLIDTSLLSLDERGWVNEYHTKCRESISPLLSDDSPALKWLHRWTEPI